mgnify:CR=1 FL=1|jgi:hypothetical protein|tara:strand:+ start:24623 stop:25234 length:612 start_codon:yes stop_codon:yes gene_type:complete
MALSRGHQVICCDRNRRGGLKNVWLIESDKLTGPVTFNAAGQITSFPTSNAYQFDFDRGTGGFSANASRENGSTIITVELEFYIPKVTGAVNTNLDELARSCGLFAIVESYADDCGDPTADPAVPASTYFFVLGYDEIFESTAYMEFASGEMTSGVGLQDASGTLVKLSGEQGEYPCELDMSNVSMTDPTTGSGTYTDAWVIT